MTTFTVEISYTLPVYYQATIEATSIEQACQMALDGDYCGEWKQDYDSSGPLHVSGAWLGEDCAYEGEAVAVPELYREKSAAPSLLAALEELMGWHDHTGGWEGEAWKVARAAIAQAKGE